MIGSTEVPLICAPLVAKKQADLLNEAASVLAKKPDIIEWRADFFEEINQADRVIATANEIKQLAGAIPVIFTIRSTREGGQPIPLSDQAVIELNAAICRSTKIEYVDCELSNSPEHIIYLRDLAKKSGTKLIGSFHNFQRTPGLEELALKFGEAEQYLLDVAKIAVMPQNLEDVLTLLSATLQAKAKLKIPLITMSMGKFGAITRMIGGVFGSSLTFGVGSQASAPGQVPIEDLQAVLEIVRKSMAES